MSGADGIHGALVRAVGASVVESVLTGLAHEDVAIVTLNPGNHIYYAKLATGKSKMFKSVSGVLKIIEKPALVVWAANLAGDYVEEYLPIGETVTEGLRKRIAQGARKYHQVTKDDSAEVGTAAHKLIEKWLKGDDIQRDLVNADDRIQNCVALFWTWWESQDLEVMHSELCVWDATLGIAGTVDFVCRSRKTGRVVLIDFKTGNNVWPEQFLQLAAYTHMLSFKGIDVEEAAILRIGKHDAKPFFYDAPMGCLRACFVGLLCAYALGRVIDKVRLELDGKEPVW